MLTLHPLNPSSPDLPAVRALYHRAFPPNEQRAFDDMLSDTSGICELLSLHKDGQTVGFACILTCIGISHIIYFAIEESLRGQGLGGEALALFHAHCAPRRVIVDIERCGEAYPDNAMRSRRKDFYLRAGYQENPVFYRWQQEDYEVLSYGGSITHEEFCDFWDAAYASNPLIG